jgi:hypothetical protein
LTVRTRCLAVPVAEVVQVCVVVCEIDDGVLGDRGLLPERRWVGGRRVVRHLLPEIGPDTCRIDHVHLEVVDVDAVALPAPVHQGELTEHLVAGAGVEGASRHADGVPAFGVGDVELHQVGVKIGRALRVEVQVDAARRVADADARLDAQLVTAAAEEAGPCRRTPCA